MTTKEKVKELWKLCFTDSEEFTELYFRLRYSDHINIMTVEDDKVVSALQMLPYAMTFYGSEIDTSYISGACTHPEYRGKGVMKNLLLQAFAQMAKQNILISTLIPAEPWLFDYYAKVGYAPVFHYMEKDITPVHVNKPEKMEVKYVSGFDADSYVYFSKKMHEYPCSIQHAETDYRAVLEDITLSGGVVLAIYNQHKIVGMAFTSSHKIHELLADNELIEQLLIEETALYYQAREVLQIIPTNAGNVLAKPLGMARIINVTGILSLYAAANPDRNIRIELADYQLPANNGYYNVIGGKCRMEKKYSSGDYIRLDIADLTKMLFASTQPYMSLMLN